MRENSVRVPFEVNALPEPTPKTQFSRCTETHSNPKFSNTNLTWNLNWISYLNWIMEACSTIISVIKFHLLWSKLNKFKHIIYFCLKQNYGFSYKISGIIKLEPEEPKSKSKYTCNEKLLVNLVQIRPTAKKI